MISWDASGFVSVNKARVDALMAERDALADEVARLRRIEAAARGFADHVSYEDHEPDDFIDSDIGPPVCIQDGQVWPCFVARLYAALATDERGEG